MRMEKFSSLWTFVYIIIQHTNKTASIKIKPVTNILYLCITPLHSHVLVKPPSLVWVAYTPGVRFIDMRLVHGMCDRLSIVSVV